MVEEIGGAAVAVGAAIAAAAASASCWLRHVERAVIDNRRCEERGLGHGSTEQTGPPLARTAR